MILKNIKSMALWLAKHIIYGLAIYFATALGLPETLKQFGFSAASVTAQNFFTITNTINWQSIYCIGLFISLNWLVAANIGFVKKIFKLDQTWDMAGLDAVNYIALETPYGKSYDSEQEARMGAANFLWELSKTEKICTFGKIYKQTLVNRLSKKVIKSGKFIPIKNVLALVDDKNMIIVIFFDRKKIIEICPPNENYAQNHWRI